MHCEVVIERALGGVLRFPTDAANCVRQKRNGPADTRQLENADWKGGKTCQRSFVANRHARCGFKSRLSHHLQLGISKLFPGKKRLDRTRLNLQVCELAVQRAASGTHQASYP
jgi:hypothetical protein